MESNLSKMWEVCPPVVSLRNHLEASKMIFVVCGGVGIILTIFIGSISYLHRLLSAALTGLTNKSHGRRL